MAPFLSTAISFTTNLLPTTNPCRSTNVDITITKRLFETVLDPEKILTFISYVEKKKENIILLGKR